MASNKEKLLPFVCHCLAHPKDAGNSQVEFIPANKESYRLPLLDAVTLLAMGWSLVTQEAIAVLQKLDSMQMQ